MESKNDNLAIKKMANIGNPQFLNYINSDIIEHKSIVKTKNTIVHIRLDNETHYKFKKACQLIGFSQQLIGFNAINAYLKYIGKELNIDLSEGYNDIVG